MSDLYLIHHGIEGQKWGIRRFQNRDGTLTAEGRARYLSAKREYRESKKAYKSDKENRDAQLKMYEAKGNMKKAKREYENTKASERLGRITRQDYQKELKSKTEELSRESNKELYSKYDSLFKEQKRLSDKYDFDADDGGGGSTKASSDAGKKYMEIWDQLGELESRIKDSQAKTKKLVEKDLLKKYGNETISQIMKAEATANVAGNVAFALTAIGGTAIGTAAGHPVVGFIGGSVAGVMADANVRDKIH